MTDNTENSQKKVHLIKQPKPIQGEAPAAPDKPEEETPAEKRKVVVVKKKVVLKKVQAKVVAHHDLEGGDQSGGAVQAQPVQAGPQSSEKLSAQVQTAGEPAKTGPSSPPVQSEAKQTERAKSLDAAVSPPPARAEVASKEVQQDSGASVGDQSPDSAPRRPTSDRSERIPTPSRPACQAHGHRRSEDSLSGLDSDQRLPRQLPGEFFQAPWNGGNGGRIPREQKLRRFRQRSGLPGKLVSGKKLSGRIRNRRIPG